MQPKTNECTCTVDFESGAVHICDNCVTEQEGKDEHEEVVEQG